MAVPFPIPPLLLAIMGGAFLFVLAGLSVVPPLATGVRQAGYERAVRPRTRPPGGHPAGERRARRRRNGRADPRPPSGAAPRRRSASASAGRRSSCAWPGAAVSMHWQIDCPAQVVASVEMAVRSVLGRCELEEVRLDDPVPSAVATARLARAATRSLRPDATSASSVPLRLAVALDQAGTGRQSCFASG